MKWIAWSANPSFRSTMVQEKVRTSALLQNGSTTIRNIASRQRPLITLASASAAGYPMTRQQMVTMAPSSSDHSISC